MIFWSHESFPSLGFAGTTPTGILSQGLCFKRNKLLAVLIQLNGLLTFKVVNHAQESSFSFYTPTSKACRAF